MSRHFGPIRQLGYVVRDIRFAMQHWIDVHGVGPFYFFDRAPIQDLQYRGAPCKAQIAFALAQSGPLQVELIAPLDIEPSLYREFLERSGEGLQHVAYWTTEFDRFAAQAEVLGMRRVLSGYTGDPAGRFAYYNGGGYPGTCIEISALSAPKWRLFDTVARAAEGWDGSDPVRRYVPEDGA